MFTLLTSVTSAIHGLPSAFKAWPARLTLLTMIGAFPAVTHAVESGPPSPDSLSTPGDSLPDLVAEALRNNPGLKAAGFQSRALHSSISHTWYLEAPEIGVEFYQTPTASFPNPVKNQMEIDYSLSQAFPFPGKIAARIDAEHKHAAMGEADLEARRRKLILDVKSAYYGLYLLDRRLEINAESRVLMGRLFDIARRQYEVGLGRQTDILRARTELTNLQTDSVSLIQMRQSSQGRLNALLNRKINRPVTVTSMLTPADVPWTLEQIQPLVSKSHPGLQGMKAAIGMREAEQAAARKEVLPDFMVEGAYKNMLRSPPGSMEGNPEDFWSVRASMSLPFAFWSLPKYRAGVALSAVNLSQAEQEYADADNQVVVRAQEALLKARSNSEQLRLSRDILLPQTGQTLESNLTAYQGGKGDFMGLLDAYRMRLLARQNAEMALAELMASQAELEEAVGLGLDEIKTEVDLQTGSKGEQSGSKGVSK